LLGEALILSPLEEYPSHQAPAPISAPAASDRAASDGGTQEWAGLSERAVIGPHHLSGFSDWTDVSAGATP
jgi:hypothetical protein